MARWDEILTLPVQSPPTLEFSAADIVWSRVEGWRENMDRLALIPFSRVNDFVRGESNNKECPTKFHVEARRRRPPEMAYKPKVDGILEYILYWCSFGPDDHRKGGVVRPSRNYAAKRKTPAGRPNTKRGCVCHFIVKRLIAEPSVALIIYNQDKHVDKKGLPCHGPQDKKAAGTRAMFAPYISDELRLQIMSLLHVGVPVETIMQRHTEAVEKQGGPCNRDDLLTHRYVRRLERKIRRSSYELDSDDAVSIGMWIESHRDHIFFYEDFSNSEPFVLGIQTEWQLQQMIHFGNHSVLAADSRFGTNKLKYPIYSLLVFDTNNNAIPVAWIMTPNFASGEIHRWMGALYDRVHSKDPTWKLGGFIVDDPSADVLTIREVFQCSVLISFWRVRHAWHKNLIKKCPETEMCVEMSRRLGEVVSSICRGSGDIDSFENFIEDFIDCSDFLDYFRAVWFPRIGIWTSALKALPLASTEVSAAIECYHHQMKLRLLNEKDPSVYQRADWLVDKLGTKVHSYYWLDEYAGKDNFSRYWKDEWKSGLTSWQQALQIPDSDVSVNGKSAQVISHENQEEVLKVLNPGSEFAICDCSWSRMGNLCKHVLKSTRIYRDRGLALPSTSLFEYNRTLMTILHCPPHDSLIRDHAIALSVSIQSQLNALFDLESSSYAQTTSVPKERQTAAEPGVSATENLDDADDLMVERQSVSENYTGDLRKESHSFLEKNGVAGETVGDSAACHITHAAETVLLPVEQQLPNNGSITNSLLENETGNSLCERLNLDSDAHDAPESGDASLDDMSIDARCNEAPHKVSADQVSDNIDKSVAKDMMDIDQASIECLPPAIISGDVGGATKGGLALHDSDVSEIKIGDVSDANPPYFVIVDNVEVTNGFCHGTVEKALVVDDRLKDVVENVSLDENVAKQIKVADIVVSSGNDCRTAGAAAIDHSNGVAADRAIGEMKSNTEVCKTSKLGSNDSVMGLVPCSGVSEASKLGSNDSKEEVVIGQQVNDATVKEGISDDSIMLNKKDNELILNAKWAIDRSSSGASEEKADDMQSSLRPTAEIHSDPMDVDISADLVNEVTGDSPGTKKDHEGVAFDASSVNDGICCNTEERSSNDHITGNAVLSRCSTLEQS